MTLIEILVAVSISTLIVAVALAVYFTVSGSLRRQQERRWQSAVEALDVLRRDLTCCLPSTADGNETFILDSEEGPDATNYVSALLCTTAVVPPERQDVTRFEAVRVRYVVQPPAEPKGETALLRQLLTPSGAGTRQAPGSNVLLRGVAGFQIRVLAGEAWTNRWKSSLKQPLPRAARVRLAWTQAGGTEDLESWVLIPAGHVIASPSASRRQPTKPAAVPVPSWGPAAPQSF